jgi:hypothetical protein
MNEFEIRRLIRDAGFEPRRRNFYYGLRDEPSDLDASLLAEANRDKRRVPIAVS